MQQQAANTGIELIDRDECLVLLASDEIGRLAVIDGARPVIFPVNYVLHGEDIVFRTAPGTKVEQGPRSPACFEIDAFDRPHRAGWSVLVTGRLEELTPYDSAHFTQASVLPVHPWAAGEKNHLMRLVAATITGRRIRGTG
ncbi:MAG: pyridoxamine 5'-phosphate oxidase family protein [Actinomycetota bacterium]